MIIDNNNSKLSAPTFICALPFVFEGWGSRRTFFQMKSPSIQAFRKITLALMPIVVY